MRTDAKQFSELVVSAFLAGNDDLVIELHYEANQDYGFYLDVWSNLPSPMRARIKELVDRDNRSKV
jgi:hypothetical protein